MELKPVGNKIVVKPVASPSVSNGGIILTQSNRERIQRGEVVAIGTGKTLQSGQFVPMTVKVGDIVLYGKVIAVELPSETGEKLLCMTEDDVIAIEGKEDE